MEQNTQVLVDLYNKLGKSIGPDGNPILSVTQVQTTQTYMQQRTFDASSGVELSPILTPVDVSALDTSIQDLTDDTTTVQAIQSLVNQITASPGSPIHIKAKM